MSTVQIIAAAFFAALIAFTLTPSVRVLAYKFNAIDVPEDGRRMHKIPIPRLGGLAIFGGFFAATIVFCEFSPMLAALWIGGSVITVLGVLDDIYRLNALVKLLVQIAVSAIPVILNIKITQITLFGSIISFGGWSVPVTMFWIVALTNAINLIDGLDGLSCGVSAICSISLLMVTIQQKDTASIILTAILAGSCIGFLPFNSNPAKIFMGDTGALFLGYTMSLISINGLFKTHTILSFMIPLSIFALPIFDTAFAFIRRIFKGQSPFKADRGHLHHRLIDMGLSQKQSVYILYSICAILGLSAVMFSGSRVRRAALIVVVGVAIFLLNFRLYKNPKTKHEAGMDDEKQNTEATDKDKKENDDK